MHQHCEFYGASDRGQQRSVNQDRILVAEMGADRALLVVADGMGGEAAGDRASEQVVQTIRQRLQPSAPDLDGEGWFSLMESMVFDAQAALEAAVSESPELAGMGTTLTMACCRWPSLQIVHVGDSRCYLLRDGELTQITKDHSVAQRFVEEGVMSAEEAEHSPMAHQLYNVVTSEREIQPESHELELQPGDSIVLCSDGLDKHVEDDDIAATLADASDAESACRTLIRMANEGGGSDNISVVVARFR